MGVRERRIVSRLMTSGQSSLCPNHREKSTLHKSPTRLETSGLQPKFRKRFLSFSLEQGSGAPSLRPAERAVSRGELRGGVRPAAQPEHEAGHRGWEVTPGRGLGLSRPGISCGLASEDEDLTSVDEDLASVDDSVLLSSRGGCLEGAAPRLRSGAPEGRSSLRV